MTRIQFIESGVLYFLPDDSRAQQAIAEALKEVNERLARQAREKQQRKILQVAENGVQGDSKSEGQGVVKSEGQGEVKSEGQGEVKSEGQGQVKSGGQGEIVVENSAEAKTEDGDGVKSGGQGDLKPDRLGEMFGAVSIADSAKHTGEDPELAGLVSDDENDENSKKEEKRKNIDEVNAEEKTEEQNANEEMKSKTENAESCNDKVDESGHLDDNVKEDNNEGKRETEHSEPAGDQATAGSEEVENAEDGPSSEQPVSEHAQNGDRAAEGVKDSDVDGQKHDEKDENKENNDQEKTELAGDDTTEGQLQSDTETHPDAAVAVMVTGPDTAAEAKEPGEGAEDGGEKSEGHLSERSAGSPEATYKERPITSESLAKSLSKDRGGNGSPKKTVATLNADLHMSESRRNSAKYRGESIEASTKKKMTISAEEEQADGQKKEEENKEQKKVEEKTEPVEPRGKDPTSDRMDDELKLMEAEYSQKQFDKILKRGNELMRALKKLRNIHAWSKRRLTNFAKVHSFMGSTNSEKQNFEKARTHHKADLKIGGAIEDTKIQSRALEHLGRTYIFEKKYEKALEFFAKRAHLPRDTEETARLFHEIANCFFLLKAKEFAKDAAMVSLKAANEGNHSMFQLQSTVLIAVTKVKLNRTDGAFQTCEEALKYAKIRDDQQASQAIEDAMKQIQDRIATEVKDKWLKKIRKDPETAAKLQEKDKEGGSESATSVFGLLNSMTEEDAQFEALAGEGVPTDEETARGQHKGSETSRTDRNGFLLAPEGPMERRTKSEERIIKVQKTAEEEEKKTKMGKTPRKKSVTGKGAKTPTKDSMKGETAGRSQPTSKSSGKNAKEAKSPSGADKPKEVETAPSVQVILPEESAAAGENGPAAKETNLPGGAASNDGGGDGADAAMVEKDENGGQPKGEETVDDKKNESNITADNVENPSVANPPDADNADATEQGKPGDDNVDENMEDQKENNKDTNNEHHVSEASETKGEDDAKETDKTENVLEESQGANNEHKTPENPTGQSGDAAHDKTLPKAETEAQKPSPRRQSKPKPKPPQKTEEEIAMEKQAEKERRMSQRFIGLDPKKVEEFKANPPRLAEGNQSPKKPKSERFVGLKPKKKSPTQDDTPEEKRDGNLMTEESPRETVSEVTDRRESLAPPSVTRDGRSPPPAETAEKDGAGYDDNVPTTPLLVLSDELPMIRKDSIVGRHSNHRPATRMSLADLVKDDAVNTKTTSSQAELSALNDLVKDAIRYENKTVQRPAKENKPSVGRNSLANIKDRRRLEVEEKEAATKRARRKRFLKNRKASFLLMLNSSYAEVTSIYGTKYSPGFTLLRRKTLKSHNFSPEKMNFVEEDREGEYEGGLSVSPRKRKEEINGESPSRYWRQGRQSDYDKSPRDRELTEQKSGESPTKRFGTHRKSEEFQAEMARRKAQHEKAGSSRIERELELAAKEMRRRERDERREARLNLQEAERRRRIEEKEEKELLSLSPKASFPNPYNLRPKKIPGMEHKKFDSDEEERAWLVDEERKLRREKRRERREKELKRRQAEEKRKRKFEQLAKKKSRVSLIPSDQSPDEGVEDAKEVEEREKEQEMEDTPHVTPTDQSTPEDERQRGEAWQEEERQEKEKLKEDERKEEMREEEKEKDEEGEEEMEPREDDQRPVVAQVGGKARGGKAKGRKPRGGKARKGKNTKELQEDERREEEEMREEKEQNAEGEEEMKPREDDQRPEVAEVGGTDEQAKEEEDKKEQEQDKKEEENVEEEAPSREDGEEEETTEPVDDYFDGYNDDDEDEDDLVAIYIEKEVRQMRDDYNKGQLDDVISRGTDLLKALRKHTDIVSWSRRRLRWFSAAHSYMGSAHADKQNNDKARSHHQADFRIGEALEDPKMMSRALEHIARTHISDSNMPKALEILAQRARLPRDSEQSSRLFLDMAYCFFQMGALQYARDAAIQSLDAAKEGNHLSCQLQSSLLVAVCHSKLQDFDEANATFQSALEHAQKLDDKNTELAIQDALKQLEMRRAARVRDKWRGKVAKGDAKQTIQEEEEEMAKVEV